MVIAWLSRVLARYSWTKRTVGRGRRRVTQRKWVSWPNIDWLLTAKLRLEHLEDRAVPALFTVTTVGDSGLGSLRQAILDANAAAGADSIAFAIPGAGVQTIQPLAPLPAITDKLTLDASTQPGFAGVPLIELRGDLAGTGPSVNGFDIAAGNVTVRGFVINRFDRSGVRVEPGADFAVVVGNWIGLATDGTAAGNANGVSLLGGGSHNVGANSALDRNVISGNTIDGVQARGVAGTQIIGNYLGTDPAGTAAVPNLGYGVRVDTGSFAVSVNNNVVSGNTSGGVLVSGAGRVGFFNTIHSNLIGLDASGTAAVGNGFAGVFVSNGSFNTRVGLAALGNVVSGNAGPGVSFADAGTDGNTLQGNWIGTNAAGTAVLGDLNSGVEVRNGASNTLIDANVIAKAYSQGIFVGGSGVPEGTVAWFKGNGTLANSGGPVGGTAVGTVTYATGQAGTQALNFARATGGYVTSQDITGYGFSPGSLTVAAWVNPATLPADGDRYQIVAAADPGQTAADFGFGLIGSPGGTRLYFDYRDSSNASPTYTATSDPLPGFVVGSFRHVAVIWTGNHVDYYVDGSYLSTLRLSSGPPATIGAKTLTVGGRDGVAVGFDGRLEDVAVVNRALPAAQIARIASFGGAG